MGHIAGWLDLGAKGLLEAADEEPLDMGAEGKDILMHLITMDNRGKPLNVLAQNGVMLLRKNDISISSGHSYHLDLDPLGHSRNRHGAVNL